VTNPAAEDAEHITFTVWTGHHSPVIVTLGGELDIVSAPTAREELIGLLRPGASELVIDMSGIRYADASGLAVLVGTQRRAELLGGSLRLAALQPEVARVLAVTGISQHLDAYPTVEAAIAGRRPAGGGTPLLGTGLPGNGLPGSGLPGSGVRALPAQGAESVELRAAITALLANADAWRDADPRRRFSPALRVLAQAQAGASYTALAQAAQSLVSVLSREPLTYSPAVAATASRLRRLFVPGPALAAPAQCSAG
jgi:anti-sigma B factor antagonist